MGSKLINKVSFILLLIILFSACKVNKQKKLLNSEEEDNYILSFKKTVLYGCINEGTDKNFYTLLSEHNDLGIYTEVAILLHDTALKAQGLGAKHVDEIDIVNYPDAENKKPLFRNCVNYAFSKEIDSIAREFYRKSKS